MGKKYNNAITTTAGFNYAAQRPLDDRMVVQNYSDLAELIEAKITYIGMEVYVVDDKKSYKLIDEEWEPVATEQYVSDQINNAQLNGNNDVIDAGHINDWINNE